MLKIKTILVCFLLSCAVYAQQPAWLDANTRNAQYPASGYLTGFASGNEGVERVKTNAQTSLLENLRVVISGNTKSEKKAVQHNDKYDELDIFSESSEKSTFGEIAGMKVESYTDKQTNTVYAFAFVNKYELIGYYKANLSLQFQQAQSALTTAEQLESSGEKAKARKLCEEALSLLAKIRSVQDLLISLDNTTNNTNLKVSETEQMKSTLTQMQARLAQAVHFYISGSENLFGKSENIIANKVKADLAHKGCSFVENAEQADFLLKIKADVRLSSQVEGMVFCYADVEIELFDNHKQKAVFGDEFSEKGGSSSQEKAGRKAMESASKKIGEKLVAWIE